MAYPLVKALFPPGQVGGGQLVVVTKSLDFLAGLTALVVAILAVSSVISLSTPVSYLLLGAGGVKVFCDLADGIYHHRRGYGCFLRNE